MKVEFLTTPPIGTVVMFDHQAYRLANVEPYTRKDGEPSKLLTWVSQCPDCGGEFPVQTGLKSKDWSRRCPEHRKPFVRVKKAGRGPGSAVTIRVIEPEGSK